MDCSSFAVSVSNRIALFPFTTRKRVSNKTSVSFRRKFVVLACNKEEQKFDKWDQMELKFGRMLGEDPKLTMAKIMARKLNPDASYLDIEESYYRNKGKVTEVEEVPFDTSKNGGKSTESLNLVRPVPKKGIKFQTENKTVAPEMKEPIKPVGKSDEKARRSVPNVILRKPAMFYEESVEDNSSSRLRIKPNLNLNMRNEKVSDRFTDMTLLRKPESMSVKENDENTHESSSSSKAKSPDDVEMGIKSDVAEYGYNNFTLLEKPGPIDVEKNLDTKHSQRKSSEAAVMDDFQASGSEELQPHKQYIAKSTEGTAISELSNNMFVDSTAEYSIDAALKGKPQRLHSSVKQRSNSGREEVPPANPGNYGSLVAVENRLAELPLEEQEEKDWLRAESLVKTQRKGDVEIISSSAKGFAVSFASLIGFLPYRNFASKWKFFAFESWLRNKGLDPSKYRENIGVTGSYHVTSSSSALNASPDSEVDANIKGEISSDMKLKDLLKIYDQEKLKFLSSFVGQKVKLNVLLADRSTKKLVFSTRPKEKEELLEKKRSLMARLRIGDVVKCCITKITYFGIFVEVEGEAALIHQTEVSWDATLDPASYYKVGQILEAKVHELDFALERIFLSLKENTQDPLIEALESVVGDQNTIEGMLEAAEADAEWPEVESLIEELQKVDGIQSVSKGRFFLSPGLAPTFQVYMASMFENQYKLLARSGKNVQEVIVEASLGKEDMKSAILTSTNRLV